MTEVQPNPVLKHIQHLVGSISTAALSDGELLERFLAARDETAVEVLVRRYGPLVLGVCRRVLHNVHAAEDVFQATFLVLLRRAPALDGGKPLGGWLYTVAYRLAVRARSNELRRQRCETRSVRCRASAVSRSANPSELTVALEEELHKLPERHRVPLVLCYFEGKTNDQAAEILGCPRGSIAARLDQARLRLRERLARRGFAAPAAGIAAVLATASAQASVPLTLLNNSVRAVLWVAHGQASAAGLVSSEALALAQAASRAMFVSKFKVATVLIGVALLGAGASKLLRAAPVPVPDVIDAQPVLATNRAEVPATGADRTGNAAVNYGQAFIALRRGFQPVGEKRLVAECLSMPLDASAREVVTKGAYALLMVQRGAALPRCDWRTNVEQGLDLSSTHGEGAQQLSALACLRARLRFEEGRHAEAIADIVAALTLARHISLDGTLDSLWTGYDIEQRMNETLALYLPKLDAPSINDLKTRLGRLPPGGSVSAATMRMGEELLTWIVGEVHQAKDRETLLTFLSQLCGSKDGAPEKNRDAGRVFLEECGGSGAGVIKFAVEMRARYAAVVKQFNLPAQHVDKALEREGAALAGNPVFKLFTPVLKNIRRRQAQAEIRRALLTAALAVQAGGREALKNHPDPVLGVPFEYTALANGFELRSTWKVEDTKADRSQPIKLTIGQSGR